MTMLNYYIPYIIYVYIIVAQSNETTWIHRAQLQTFIIIVTKVDML